MNALQPTQRLRSSLVWIAATGVAALLLRWFANQMTAPLSGPPRFDELLTRGCLLALAGCTIWAWAAVTAVVLEVLRTPTGTRLSGAGPGGVPPLVRRMVLLACGVALAGAVASPAGATPGPLVLGPGQSDDSVSAGLPYPDRPLDRDAGPPRAQHEPHHGQTERSSTSSAARAAPAQVTVRSGDTLWDLARTRLTADADAGEVVEATQRLYRANRTVIGIDPDLIVPGQQLRVPFAGTAPLPRTADPQEKP